MSDREPPATSDGDAWDHPERDLEVGRGVVAWLAGSAAFAVFATFMFAPGPNAGKATGFEGVVILLASALFAASSLVVIAFSMAKRVIQVGRLLAVAFGVSAVPVWVLASISPRHTDPTVLVLGAAWTAIHYGTVLWARPGRHVATVVLACGVAIELAALLTRTF